MPQKKKKTNKKSHKKSHTKHINIIQQTIPNYASGQMTGHQYNKDHVQFAPATQQSHTDNIVGELVGRLMNKIENDGNKEVQQYSKEVQPITNTSSSSITGPLVQIYNDGTKKSDTPESTKPSIADSVSTTIKDSVSSAVKENTRTAAEDYAIQTASAATGLLGVGALGYAANTELADKAKIKLKGVGSGILGAVTSGASAIGSAFKRGPKLGGNVDSSKLVRQEKPNLNIVKEELVPQGDKKMYYKKGKPGEYQNLEDSQKDFDNFLGKKNIKLDGYMKSKYAHLLQNEPPTTPIKTNEIVPKPASTPTPTPSKNSIFTPAIYLSRLRPQKILSSNTPSLDIFKAGTAKPKYILPVEEQVKQLNAGSTIAGAIKRKVAQLDYKGFRKEAKKIQKVGISYAERKNPTIKINRANSRPSTTLNLAPVEPEISYAPPAAARARTSGVQQSEKMITRSRVAESGIRPVQLQLEKQPRKIYPSDVGEYRSGQRARNKDIAKNTEKQFAPVWNMEDKYNQGYFSKELAKKGRPKSSILSQANTPAPVKRNLSNYMKER